MLATSISYLKVNENCKNRKLRKGLYVYGNHTTNCNKSIWQNFETSQFAYVTLPDEIHARLRTAINLETERLSL